MPILYQADNDLRYLYLRAVRRREPAIDFQSALTARLDGVDDLTVLRKAASEQRILVSHDKRTLPRALGGTARRRNRKPGNLSRDSTERAIQRVADSLILAWAASEALEWTNRITKIPF